jgi:hypothetical protein
MGGLAAAHRAVGVVEQAIDDEREPTVQGRRTVRMMARE